MVSRIASSAFSRFQSTLPARGATHHHHRHFGGRAISIHAPRTGERRLWQVAQEIHTSISIHAPRTGSDADARHGVARADISIHAPRTGSDRHPHPRRHAQHHFQSTLPARGATHRYVMVSQWVEFQSTLPARGSDAISLYCGNSVAEFQSTLPARGSDRAAGTGTMQDYQFQSTLPARGSDTGSPPSTAAVATEISIHAPRTGSDRA